MINLMQYFSLKMMISGVDLNIGNNEIESIKICFNFIETSVWNEKMDSFSLLTLYDEFS